MHVVRFAGVLLFAVAGLLATFAVAVVASRALGAPAAGAPAELEVLLLFGNLLFLVHGACPVALGLLAMELCLRN